MLSDEDEDDEMDVIEKHMKRQSRNLHANTGKCFEIVQCERVEMLPARLSEKIHCFQSF